MLVAGGLAGGGGKRNCEVWRKWGRKGLIELE
jgi:hypothetical protein